MSSRYRFLSNSEIATFDSPQAIEEDKRSFFFQDSDRRFKNAESRIGFILLRAYFLTQNRFFTPSKFLRQDIIYVSQLVKYDSSKILKLENQWYKESTLRLHKNQILEETGFIAFESSYNEAKTESINLVKKAIRPKKIFFSLVKYLIEHKIEIPNYSRISTLIMETFNTYEGNIVQEINQLLDDEKREVLDQFITMPTEEGELSPHNPYLITTLKSPSQETKTSKIKESVKKFNIIAELFNHFEVILNDLTISESLVNYYASWMIIAEQPQFNAIKNPEKRYLYVLSFIAYQYRIRQDLFLDIFIKTIQSFLNQVENRVKDDFINQRKAPSKQVNEAKDRIIRNIDKQETKLQKVRNILTSPGYSAEEKVRSSLLIIESNNQLRDQIIKEFQNLEASISEKLKDEMYYEKVSISSLRLSRKLKDLFISVRFNEKASDPIIYKPVFDYQSKKGNIATKPNTDFLSATQQKYLKNSNGQFDSKLYKALLFIESANNIKSGALNLKYSNNYRSINDYMIDEDIWSSNKIKLLESTNLLHLINGAEVLSGLKEELHLRYAETNEKLFRNEHVKIDKKGKPVVSTPKNENNAQQSLKSLISNDQIFPLVDILFDISESTNFLDSFIHFSMKRGTNKPEKEVLIAGIIALGCNIGIRKMGKITKGIGPEKLENTVRWFFSQENLNEANRVIIELIDRLSIPKYFKEIAEEHHTSSDGQKFGVSVPSIHSSYSYKYFGTGRGVTAYSFIDEYSRLFYDTVISASEREAAYVLDGLLYNDVVESTIHSTDTHGYTEVIFGVCNSLGIKFAPRIKNPGSQILYTFKDNPSKSYKEKGYQIIPEKSKYIDENHLLNQWDNILRLLVSLKTKKVTASVLLKRLSSYAKNHPLYQALKEIGRIHKSLFLLEYYNDPELRQRIEKQLNKGELWHKFAKEIFFGNNQEFKVGTKEEQNLAVTCRNLIQNSVVLWNYLTLTKKISNVNKQNQEDLLSSLNSNNMISWQHVNIHGEYDFELMGSQSEQFDVESLIQYEFEPADQII